MEAVTSEPPLSLLSAITTASARPAMMRLRAMKFPRSGDFIQFLLIENQLVVILRRVRWARRGHKNENFGPVKNPKILRFCNLKIAKLSCDQSVSPTYLSNGSVKDYAFVLQI